MSLINDALKKAQKQRTGDVPPLASLPSVGGESAARIAKRAKPAGFNTLLTRIGLVAAALVVVLVGGYFAIRQMRAMISKPDGTKSGPATASLSPTTAASKIAPAESTAAPAVTFNLPVNPPPAAETKVAPLPAAVARPAESAPEPKAVAPAPLPVPPAAPSVAPKLGTKAVTFIETLRIAGIRASATDSKVLMNDRVYRNGDIVEHELGLKLVGITSDSLTFEDEHGARYTRNF